ncbi:hypothetical protein DL96DRAFT_877606 [Flagelloscypha sp. PMI_526]|nr:hypothetical protein DL96DRAFT_877606 [Flagelloscypha sp. PMI_526]
MSSNRMYLTASLVLVSSLAMIVIEALTLTMLWKNYDRIEKLDYTKRNDQLSLNIVIRTSIFSLYPIVALGMIVPQIVNRKESNTGPRSPAPDLIQALCMCTYLWAGKVTIIDISKYHFQQGSSMGLRRT